MIRILPAADNPGVYELLEGDTRIGEARATFDEQVHLLSVQAPDDLLAEGLVRAVLNAGRVREIPVGVCENPQLFSLLARLEFSQTDGRMVVDIPTFFGTGCPSERQRG